MTFTLANKTFNLSIQDQDWGKITNRLYVVTDSKHNIIASASVYYNGKYVIKDVYVNPRRRSIGLGNFLLTEAEEFVKTSLKAKKNKKNEINFELNAIYLVVDDSNMNAIEWYSRHGFVNKISDEGYTWMEKIFAK
jgi:ribosomal protein S18 acetylase RimI-like enzyme